MTTFQYLDEFDPDRPKQDLRVVLRNVTIVYPTLFAPRAISSGVPKFSVQVLIPKKCKKTTKDITQYFSLVKTNSVNTQASQAATYFRDGDMQQNRDHELLKEGDPGFKPYLKNNRYFNISAKMEDAPELRDMEGRALSLEKDKDPFYTGCLCDVYFYSYVVGGTFPDDSGKENKVIAPTISKRLMAVQLVAKGEPIITRTRPKLTNDVFINYAKEHIASDNAVSDDQHNVTKAELKKALLDFAGDKNDPDYPNMVIARQEILKSYGAITGKLKDLDSAYYYDVLTELTDYDSEDDEI